MHDFTVPLPYKALRFPRAMWPFSPLEFCFHLTERFPHFPITDWFGDLVLSKPPYPLVPRAIPPTNCSVTQSCLTATPWTAAQQASLSFTISQSLPKFMSIALVMPSSHLILCHPLLLPSIFPSIRVFSKESVLHIRWPKYCSFSFSISPSNE